MSDLDYEIPREDVPEGFAECIENPPEVPVTPRPAATIVLLRDGAEGSEVLLMRRSRRAGFVPGAYVFPGGRVDRADGEPSLLPRLIGLSPPEAEARLDLVGADPPAIAYYLAALREAFEETGILVATRSDGAPPPTAAQDPSVDAVRNAVMADEVSFSKALEELDCRIAGDAIEYVAHWITPEPEPRRYDTRFFAAVVPSSAVPIVDPREMTDALWIRPADAISGVDDGTLPMVFPTIKTLEQLQPFDTASAALEAIGRAPVRTIMPTLVITPTGVGMMLDAEE